MYGSVAVFEDGKPVMVEMDCENKSIHHFDLHLPGIVKATNNVAELMTFYKAVRVAKILPGKVVIKTDSQLVVGWVTKNWRIKTDEQGIRRALVENLKDALSANPHISVEQVRRTEIVPVLGH
jgi:ribonuclease HI